MDATVFLWGQFLTLLLIAIALGMDAFSLGIGLGMVGLRLRKIVNISIMIGCFHVAMPLLGIAIGSYLSDIVGDIAIFIGGSILILLGVHMLWSVFFGENEGSIVKTSGLGLILFAISVSLDALSVGFSLGLMTVNKWLAVSMFGIVGGMMSCAGLLLGRSVGGWMGEYSEIIGGVILLIFGLKFIL
ncbi:manganese efflux pump [Brevibacillus sp. 7WMA2]|uniref:Putative manganese efflux pump MntP n=1 Tax=Brevibacillus laterosporus LMG 15441 TaxID=1042163 RepID=A0A075RBW2_BRELA|nr:MULTISPECIES: manganese efflux pump MntP family protein [Brevibacillus]MCZ0835256.1 manganese efflux pump MntP family protein [Brevibacillus halotolerans]AIG28713.1 putative manganese efflux pump MntP [Brevibacillus laterosporus LMG 15441]AUM67040.1 manganese efflux pump [Brevibacillus laterosporus]AYK05898.1 manganese efflux pump [Brevibacillus laterosporus]MCR8963100.1 manganese efflux pump MntP family protein [Brevibacillus laterosporus]